MLSVLFLLSEVTFARGVVDDTPRAVDAATAVPKQTARSWRSLSKIDSNTGSQRSGRENVHDTPYDPLLGLFSFWCASASNTRCS